jgi:histidine triad (HIT) family protein
MEESVFTKIVKGDIPAHKIYEDDRTMAFLDIHPVQPGMTLVISKKQVENFEDLDPADYRALWETVQKVARRLREAFPDRKKIAVQVEGLDVAHAHVKLFPIDKAEDFRMLPDFSKQADHETLAKLAERLRFS